jgi:hypothetical protein
MAQPSSRQELIDYCLRKLGAPVLEINVAQEQIEDLVDDALQLFNERHFDGVYQTYLKYQLTENDIQRGRSRGIDGVGISTISSSANIGGNELQFDYLENGNYLQMPSHIIGVNKIFHIEGFNSISGTGMFSFKYQFFLNDMYNWGSFEILSYAMVKTYLEDIDFILNTQKQIRYNQRQDRLYLDLNWGNLSAGQFIVIDCWRLLDPNEYKKVWNDSFIKPYLTSLIKRQWGLNLSAKFKGMKLPGGIEYNGRELFEDAQREIDNLMEKMSSQYELPPLDMIG